MLGIIRKTSTLLVCFCIAFSALANDNYYANGKASYYADKFHGRLTSNGEVFHQDSLTCAHRTLPFGTLLKVTNKDNGKEVVVRVNDRGPFIGGRIVDLSRCAAKRLGMLKQGVAQVEVKEIQNPDDIDFAPFKFNFFQMYDPMLDKYYTIEEWQNEHLEDKREFLKMLSQNHIDVYNSSLMFDLNALRYYYAKQ